MTEADIADIRRRHADADPGTDWLLIKETSRSGKKTSWTLKGHAGDAHEAVASQMPQGVAMFLLYARQDVAALLEANSKLQAALDGQPFEEVVTKGKTCRSCRTSRHVGNRVFFCQFVNSPFFGARVSAGHSCVHHEVKS